jgi:hypothetical protein
VSNTPSSDFLKIPPCKGYWDIPSAPQGDDYDGPIFEEVGRALTAWESVEENFAIVFAIFLGTSSSTATRVYGALSGFPVKLVVLQEAAGGAFREANAGTDVKAAWNLLTSHYQEASNRRNEIAHGQVRRTIWLKGEEPPPGIPEGAHDFGWFLMPRHNSPKKTHPFWDGKEHEGVDFVKYRYTSRDLHVFTDRFHDLEEWTMDFWQAYQEEYQHPRG